MGCNIERPITKKQKHTKLPSLLSGKAAHPPSPFLEREDDSIAKMEGKDKEESDLGLQTQKKEETKNGRTSTSDWRHAASKGMFMTALSTCYLKALLETILEKITVTKLAADTLGSTANYN
jgi:hypothetical protein